MLKLLFWCLLLANGALFAYHQGYLEKLISDGHEPNRAAKQFNADKVKLIPVNAIPPAANSMTGTSSTTLLAVAASDGEKQVAVLSCTEIGNFDAAEAKKFESRLATLSIGDKLTRHSAQEAARHMVFIPSQGSKDGADKKAGELRQFGVKDFYVIQDGTDMQWGISLGIFKNEEAARAHLTALNQKGVHSARLGHYNITSNKVAFQLRGLDVEARSNLEKIKADFPRQDMRNCEVQQTIG
jgi:hypothetical protein